MRFVLGFVSGLAAAWAALAIWQRVPPLGPIDACDEDVWEPRRDDRRPGFDEAAAGGLPAPLGGHDAYCRYPARPCVCML